MIFGAFQKDRYFRAAEERWTELARIARSTTAFADWRRMREVICAVFERSRSRLSVVLGVSPTEGSPHSAMARTERWLARIAATAIARMAGSG